MQPIQQPIFKMKWESRALPNLVKSTIELDNGRKQLQSLYDEFGDWVKSKLNRK